MVWPIGRGHRERLGEESMHYACCYFGVCWGRAPWPLGPWPLVPGVKVRQTYRASVGEGHDPRPIQRTLGRNGLLTEVHHRFSVAPHTNNTTAVIIMEQSDYKPCIWHLTHGVLHKTPQVCTIPAKLSWWNHTWSSSPTHSSSGYAQTKRKMPYSIDKCWILIINS